MRRWRKVLQVMLNESRAFNVTCAEAAQAHYVWVRALEVIWSEYTRIISVLYTDAK